MVKIRVLSLFDGISCGRLALERIKISPDVYYASEINPSSIQVTQANFPDTKQIGDVRNPNKRHILFDSKPRHINVCKPYF